MIKQEIQLENMISFIEEGELPHPWIAYSDGVWLRVELQRGQWAHCADVLAVDKVLIRKSPTRAIESSLILAVALEKRARRENIPLVAVNTIPALAPFLQGRGYTQLAPHLPENAQQTWMRLPDA